MSYNLNDIQFHYPDKWNKKMLLSLEYHAKKINKDIEECENILSKLESIINDKSISCFIDTEKVALKRRFLESKINHRNSTLEEIEERKNVNIYEYDLSNFGMDVEPFTKNAYEVRLYN
jgi:hypothetical protein